MDVLSSGEKRVSYYSGAGFGFSELATSPCTLGRLRGRYRLYGPTLCMPNRATNWLTSAAPITLYDPYAHIHLHRSWYTFAHFTTVAITLYYRPEKLTTLSKVSIHHGVTNWPTTPLLISSGITRHANFSKSSSSTATSHTTFGRIECEVHNPTKNRSRSRHPRLTTCKVGSKGEMNKWTVMC